MIEIQPFENKYLGDALVLIEHSDSTNRSIQTWKGNDMTAILAFDGKKLIGIIPFERCRLSFNGNKINNVLWVSGAHVDSEYRSTGIGSAMDSKIKEYFHPDYQAVFVCRANENSAAYKWYKKNGYQGLSSIISFKKKVERPLKKSSYELWTNQEDINSHKIEIYNCFIKNNVSYRGFPQRQKSFWSNKLDNHYYKDFYNYCIIALIDKKQVIAYAFLGETSMKDNVERIDILEFVMPDNIDMQEKFFAAVMQVAYQRGLREIRLQLSSQDHHQQQIKSFGFTERWRYKIMGRIINPIKYFNDSLAENKLQKDYRFIIETPSYGENCFGEGENTIKLFMHDSLFTHILMNRCNIRNAVQDGSLLLRDGNQEAIYALEAIFPLYKWRFFHVDYI